MHTAHRLDLPTPLIPAKAGTRLRARAGRIHPESWRTGSGLWRSFLIGLRSLLGPGFRRDERDHWGIFILALLLTLLASPALAQDEAGDPDLKASYVYKFAAFTDWPASAFASPTAPLTLCIFGLDPFGASLDKVVAGQKINGRDVAVRRLSDTNEIAGCQLLFVGRLPGATTTDLSRTLAGKPILTVSDATRGDATGMIALVVDAGRVRFNIDADLAAAAGLTVSSKLLSLALNVRKAGH
jgi:hypothetical protein